jgi:hypothetical protein
MLRGKGHWEIGLEFLSEIRLAAVFEHLGAGGIP